MKRVILIISFIFVVFSATAFAQKTIAPPPTQRDPILEADSLHNLEVSRQYFKLKKAYKAVIDRCEETIAANPNFSRMDEVLFLAGMSSYFLSENKGKQKIDFKNEAEAKKFAPEKLREDAVAYLNILIKDYPQSEFKTNAQKILKVLEPKK